MYATNYIIFISAKFRMFCYFQPNNSLLQHSRLIEPEQSEEVSRGQVRVEEEKVKPKRKPDDR